MTKYTARLRSPADFGLAVQQARMGLGLSQTQLAQQTGLRQSAISEIETGKATIYLRQLLELARVTGVEFAATWGQETGDEAASGLHCLEQQTNEAVAGLRNLERNPAKQAAADPRNLEAGDSR